MASSLTLARLYFTMTLTTPHPFLQPFLHCQWQTMVMLQVVQVVHEITLVCGKFCRPKKRTTTETSLLSAKLIRQRSCHLLFDRVGPYTAVSYPDPNHFAARFSQHGTVVGPDPTVLSRLWDGRTRTWHGWQPYILRQKLESPNLGTRTYHTTQRDGPLQQVFCGNTHVQGAR